MTQGAPALSRGPSGNPLFKDSDSSLSLEQVVTNRNYLMRSLLLRLSDTREPVVSCSYGHGVLTLPSLPKPADYKPGDVLFTVKLVVTAGSPIARDGLIWTNVPPDGSTAVSYTHLDVYKRQAEWVTCIQRWCCASHAIVSCIVIPVS